MFLNKFSNIYRSSFAVSFWTLVSRLFGYGRDILFAAFLGSGPVAEAFIIAFRIPNLFRRFFAEGSFSAAFIPMLSATNEKLGKEAGLVFTSNIASLMLLIVFPLVILSELFMPNIILFIAPGFSDNLERLELTIPYAKVIFPYLIFIVFTALFSASLNTNGNFWVGAATPSILNIFLIIGLIVARYLDLEYGIIISWAVLFAGIFQMLLVAFANYRQGLSFKISFPKIDEKVILFLKKFFPAAFGAGVTQINLLVASIFASQIPGAISWLYYSDRVAQLPLGIIAIAIGTVLLPDLSKKINLNKNKEQSLVQERAIILILLFSFPSAVALIYLSEIIVMTLFGYGVFTNNDIKNTANALEIYAYAIPAFMLIKVLAPNYFARQDTKTPVKIAALCALINVFLCWYLVNKIGYIGIAISLSISGYVNAFILFFLLIKRKYYYLTKNFYLAFIKILLSTTVMLILLFLVKNFLLNINYGTSVFYNFTQIILFVFIGTFSYLYLCYVIGLFKLFKK